MGTYPQIFNLSIGFMEDCRFHLPSGFSIEKEIFMRRPRTRNESLLKGLKIGFVQDRENNHFDKIFSKAVSLGGADVVHVTNSQALENIDVLVSRHETKLSNAAKERSIDVLNQDWIFECFVTQVNVKGMQMRRANSSI